MLLFALNDIKSLDFVVTRFVMKIFRTVNYDGSEWVGSEKMDPWTTLYTIRWQL